MNFSNYLNNLFTYKPKTDPSLQSDATNQTTGSLSEENIFNDISREDLENIDYEKIIKSLLNNTENQELTSVEFVLKEFLSIIGIDTLPELTEKDLKNFVYELANRDGDGTRLSLSDFDADLMTRDINLDSIEHKESEVVSMVTPINTGLVSSLVSDISETRQEIKSVEKRLRTAELGESDSVKTALNREKFKKNTFIKTLNKDNVISSELKQKIIDNITALDANEDDTKTLLKKLYKVEDEIAQYDDLLNELNRKEKLTSKDLSNKEKWERERQTYIEKRDEYLKNKEELSTQKNKLLSDKQTLEKQLSHKGACDAETLNVYKDYNTSFKIAEGLQNSEIREAKNSIAALQLHINTLNTQIERVQTGLIELSYKPVEIETENIIEDDPTIEEQSTESPQEGVYVSASNISMVSASDRKPIRIVGGKNVGGLDVKESVLPNGLHILTSFTSNFQHSQPEWLDKLQFMLKAADDLGLTIVFGDMDRTVDISCSEHKKRPKEVADGGKSAHNYGLACDIVLYKNGKKVDPHSDLQKQFADKVKEYSNGSIEWGGDFKSNGNLERHHFNLKDWESKYKWKPQYMIGSNALINQLCKGH